MKRVIGSFIMVVLLYLLQTTIFNNIAIAGVKPNVILIPIVIVGYRYGRVQGMVLGFFTGLFIDLNESDYLGYYALFYLIIGYLVGFSSKLYSNDSTLVPLGLAGASDMVLNFLIYVTGFLLRNRLDLPYYMIRIILPELVYTMIVAALLYRVIDFVYLRIDSIGKGDEA